MRVVGNVLWLIFGGIELAVGYLLAGVVCILLIVTFPLAIPAFRLAGYTLWPFGRVVVRRREAGTGSTVGNLLWLVVAGWWLALGHLIAALLLAITLIGIPFAIAHVKLAKLALMPYGKDVVEARFADREEVLVAAPHRPTAP